MLVKTYEIMRDTLKNNKIIVSYHNGKLYGATSTNLKDVEIKLINDGYRKI